MRNLWPVMSAISETLSNKNSLPENVASVTDEKAPGRAVKCDNVAREARGSLERPVRNLENYFYGFRNFD